VSEKEAGNGFGTLGNERRDQLNNEGGNFRAGQEGISIAPLKVICQRCGKPAVCTHVDRWYDGADLKLVCHGATETHRVNNATIREGAVLRCFVNHAHDNFQSFDGPAPSKEEVQRAPGLSQDHTSPWQPMTDPMSVRALGKLMEELNECGSAAARSLIQGIDEADPTSGKLNRQWLAEEIADVYACLAITKEHFGLDYEAIEARVRLKARKLKAWLLEARRAGP